MHITSCELKIRLGLLAEILHVLFWFGSYSIGNTAKLHLGERIFWHKDFQITREFSGKPNKIVIAGKTVPGLKCLQSYPCKA